ncbi:MAG TPA: hypothetical protein VLX29_06820 [Nitrospirota bacterium]|nr:hypothetical protein [Nitrospirota bacterium]
MTVKIYKRIYTKVYGKIDGYQAEKMAELLLFAVALTGLISTIIYY